jgi:hypothetical protein
VPEPSYFQQAIQQAKNLIFTPEPSLYEKTGKAISAIANKGQEFAGKVSSNISNQLSDILKEGTVIGDSFLATANLVKNNTIAFSYTGAAIGGLAVMNSTINLLQQQNDEDDQLPNHVSTTAEAIKILAGSALIACSTIFGASDNLQRSTIVNAALGLALVNAAWRAAIAVKPTCVIFDFKSVENNASIKNAAVFPN